MDDAEYFKIEEDLKYLNEAKDMLDKIQTSMIEFYPRDTEMKKRLDDSIDTAWYCVYRFIKELEKEIKSA